MCCYLFPTLAAIVHFFMRKTNPKLQTKHQLLLNQLFIGGAIFGVVDHWWNGELLAINLIDVGLGVIITLSIILAWLSFVVYDTYKAKVAEKIAN